MNKRLTQLLQSGKIVGGNILLLDTYNQTIYEDITPVISTRVDASNNIYIMEYKFLQYPRGTNKGGVLNVEVCPTISCSSWENNCMLMEIKEPKIIEQKHRIRKLTPRECFRLMGVDDSDIDKIQASGISNSQQYKCAGNSIVVDVLYHLFRKMFVETENRSQQPTLF